jgi:nitrate reductase gamma subunit
MSDLLYFSEQTLQEAALIFMVVVYAIRIRWLLRFTATKERQPPTGTGKIDPKKGSRYSLANIAKPWAMESTRIHPFIYAQFVVYHLGVVAAIGLSVVIPYGPGLLEYSAVALLLKFFIGGAFIVGIVRLVRRVTDVYMRAISSPDDYFALILLSVWFAFAYISIPNNTVNGEWHLLTFFILTAFFLVYVPFSKISHYLYYPFARYYIGKSFGRRGVFPITRGPKRKEN